LLSCASFSLTAGKFNQRYFTEDQAKTIKRCLLLAVDSLTDGHQSEWRQTFPEHVNCYQMLRASLESAVETISTKENVTDIANLFS
ncbi:hypothetical protein PFISCL1PPCAC_26221, partial [Pristionchus fissidentatus]